MSPDGAKRLLAMARNIRVRVMLALGYGCGQVTSSRPMIVPVPLSASPGVRWPCAALPSAPGGRTRLGHRPYQPHHRSGV